ncbi:Hypothetical predicted protein [Paramuricea clavata]|uniref:Uncharacterized protein n=1 Tax=Paramuricea clavata TaxID=317549 RepID=A0A7D9K125_PARCT|nr:Hypothetical predicted protein [Paramuricea clavata]
MVEGKRIYREACDEKVGWNSEVSTSTSKDWIKWRQQLRNVKIPRSLAKEIRKVKAIHLHLFADASFTACSAVSIAVIEHSSGIVKGLLTSKSRIAKRNTSIPRLELVSGQMAANMAKNLVAALRRWPIASVAVWMDSLSRASGVDEDTIGRRIQSKAKRLHRKKEQNKFDCVN